MMSGMPLETCWAFNKFCNNKFYYKIASCWLFLLIQISSSQHFALPPICVKIFHSQYYLVTMVIQTQSLRSQIYIYIYTHTHTHTHTYSAQYKGAGRAKEIKKNRKTVNTTYHENLPACLRFASLATDSFPFMVIIICVINMLCWNQQVQIFNSTSLFSWIRPPTSNPHPSCLTKLHVHK